MASLLGRKRPMILASVLFLVSAVGSAYPEIGIAPVGEMGTAAIWPFNVYRLLGGVAVGIASMIAPMYVGEFAPSAVRGQLGAYQQIAIIGGMTIAYCVNWGISLQGDDVWVLATGWRWMMLALAVPAIAFFYLSFSVPESPSWLVKNGHIEAARKVLSRSAEPDEVTLALQDLAVESKRRGARAAVHFRRTRGHGRRRTLGIPAAVRHQHRALLRTRDLLPRWVITWMARTSGSRWHAS